MSQGRNPLIEMVATAMLLLTPLVHAAPQSADVWSRVDSSRVCPIASVWRLGTTDPGRSPFDMIETVVPLEVDGRTVWRTMHTLLRGTEDARKGIAPGSDFYDLDRATLAPLQSEHRMQGSASAPVKITRFDYVTRPEVVLRLNGDGSPNERIALQPGQRVLPEGPGVAALDQAITWSDGLQLRGYMVDRWRGRENQRLRQVEIAVTGRSSVEIGGRRIETFVVTEQPADGGFHMISQITVERPHRRVHIQYHSGGLKPGARLFVSEVSALLQDASCTPR